MINYLISKLIKHYKQMARYTVIGILCFVVNYAIAVFLENALDWSSPISATIGYIVGVILNYILAIKWVFLKRNLKGQWKKEFFIFIVIEIFAMLLMLITLFILEKVCKIQFEIALIVANFAAAIWNYLAKHLFLFRTHPDENNEGKADV